MRRQRTGVDYRFICFSGWSRAPRSSRRWREAVLDKTQRAFENMFETMKQTARSAQTRERLLEAAAGGLRRRRLPQRHASRRSAGAPAPTSPPPTTTSATRKGSTPRCSSTPRSAPRRDYPPETSPTGRRRSACGRTSPRSSRRLLDPDRPAWFARLLAREMIEPTPALDRLVRRRMRANHEQLRRHHPRPARPDADRPTPSACACSASSRSASSTATARRSSPASIRSWSRRRSSSASPTT